MFKPCLSSLKQCLSLRCSASKKSLGLLKLKTIEDVAGWKYAQWAAAVMEMQRRRASGRH